METVNEFVLSTILGQQSEYLSSDSVVQSKDSGETHSHIGSQLSS